MTAYARACYVFLLSLAVTSPTQATAGDTDQALQTAKHIAENSHAAPHISRDVFMQRARVRDLSLSPDGRWLTFRRDTEQRIELWLQEIESGKSRRILPNSDQVAVYWSGDGARIWLADEQGLGVFDTGTMTSRRVFRFDDARRQALWTVDWYAPAFAVLSEKIADNGEWLYRYLTIDAEGKIQVVYESRKALQSALLNADGSLRYIAGYDGDAFDTVIWKQDNGGKHELMRCPLPERCHPIAYAFAGAASESVWALAHNGEDRAVLQRFNTRMKKWEILHQDPRRIADAVSVIMQPDGLDWLAIAYRPDRVQWHGRLAETDSILDTVKTKLPTDLQGANLDIKPASDGSRWLIQAIKANQLYHRYFLYDVTEPLLTPLFEQESQSAVTPEQMSNSLPVQWRGRDGMLLHGYVYLPKGIPLNEAPLIAMIHGGPYSRSFGENDIGAQLLTNRGYIVFKPNFRASIGYGVNYVKAAGGDFGKHGVLDDIITGLDYLIANGIGNAKRQAVVGHSFGGYASLMAVTHHPKRFAFAVPSAAPVDMAWTMEDIAIEGGSALSADGPPLEVLFPKYGVPYGDESWHEQMHRDSPLMHAKNLTTPVYLWAGAKDDRVAVESNVRYMAEANADFTPMLLIDPESGHSPGERINAEALGWLIEAAAHRHFGGGVTKPSPELERFLKKNLRAGGSNLQE
ncbi:prolyl oligopeptidase family serine peptidase [Microbulbifer sp. ALW1]|uniref:S9 family peptidase n=1 Tax=Microbulbifer sp. (strain ALW1) TaxID=1516059 RepID=UPI001359B0C0|nr:prolyl oligopeptidase family serine peptidase [Microbulbifer sp. ALW1]